MNKKHPGDCIAYSRVVDSRFRKLKDDIGFVWRVRYCEQCKVRFETNEISLDELARLRAIARAQQEIVDLAESIYDRFGPKPDDLKNGAAVKQFAMRAAA